MNNGIRKMSLSEATIFAQGLVGDGGTAHSFRVFQVSSFSCLGRAAWHLKKSS